MPHSTRQSIGETHPPHRADPASNAAYAALRGEARKKARERLLLTLIYPLPWLAGGYYAASLRGMPSHICALAGIHFTLSMLMLLACLFFFGGIEGYEASIALKPYSLDLWMSGVGGNELGTAVLTHASGRYDKRLLRLAGTGVSLLMLCDIAGMVGHAQPMTLWFASVGVAPAFFLMAAIGRQEAFATRNSAMWIGLVRKSHELEFTELGIQPEARRLRIWRASRAIFVAVILVGATASASLFVFAVLERRVIMGTGATPWDRHAAFALMAAGFHAGAGFATGLLASHLAQRHASANFQRLCLELNLLTRYRAELRKGGQ